MIVMVVVIDDGCAALTEELHVSIVYYIYIYIY